MARPSTYLNWIPTGSAAYITQPSAGTLSSGWTGQQSPPYQYMNWLFYMIDQWIQYLDSYESNLSAAEVSALSNILDTTGDTTDASDQLTVLASTAGILVGMSVSGAGIPSGSYVTFVSGTTVTISQPATATASGVALSFSHANATGATVQLQLDELDALLSITRATVPYLSTPNIFAALITANGGITVPSGETATVAGTLDVTGTSDLASVNASGLLTANGGIDVAGGTLSIPNAVASNQAVALGQFVSQLSGNGYIKLPGGLIIQWGFTLIGPGGIHTRKIRRSSDIERTRYCRCFS